MFTGVRGGEGEPAGGAGLLVDNAVVGVEDFLGGELAGRCGEVGDGGEEGVGGYLNSYLDADLRAGTPFLGVAVEFLGLELPYNPHP